MDETSALWSVAYRTMDEGRVSAQSLWEEAVGFEDRFPDAFTDMLSHTDKDSIFMFRARDKSPFAHDSGSGIDITKMPVIFIGDSNHAVSPFAGNGANLAFSDACDLSEALLDATCLEDAVKAYDRKSVPRAAAVIKQSHTTIWMSHSAGWIWWICKNTLRVLGWLIKFLT